MGSDTGYIESKGSMKKTWPAPERNAPPILEVLERILPSPGFTLEVASGTGQHAAHFCAALPEIRWQPTDVDETAIPSIDAWRVESGLDNFLPAVLLDVSSKDWPVDQADSIFCSNMVHISPWESTLGLFRGAERILRPGGLVVIYGPFLERDVETTESNLKFDESLKERNPAWALRYLHDVEAVANEHGFELIERVPMPANNITVVFRRE